MRLVFGGGILVLEFEYSNVIRFGMYELGFRCQRFNLELEKNESGVEG